MDLTQDKLDLIEKIIKDNPKFLRNEDLFDTFFNEICKRSQEVITFLNNDSDIERYIKKITTTSILNILKDSDRLKYNHTEEISQPAVSIEHNDYTKEEISYSNFPVEKFDDNELVQNGILEKITNIISKVDDEEPDNYYLKIYKLRYDDGMTQKEIADSIGLSQAEVCKRLFQLMEKVKKSLG